MVPCFRIWGHIPWFRVLGFGVIFCDSVIPAFRVARVICWSSLLVLYSPLSGFSLGTPGFPSPPKPTFDKV